jgi:hypothetical protein
MTYYSSTCNVLTKQHYSSQLLQDSFHTLHVLLFIISEHLFRRYFFQPHGKPHNYILLVVNTYFDAIFFSHIASHITIFIGSEHLFRCYFVQPHGKPHNYILLIAKQHYSSQLLQDSFHTLHVLLFIMCSCNNLLFIMCSWDNLFDLNLSFFIYVCVLFIQRHVMCVKTDSSLQRIKTQ